ncbi:MAG: proton-conducting transporter membrane subunit, partial [Planctomycetaceae bacterium]
MHVWGEIRGFLPLLLTVLPAWGAAWAWLISRHGAAAARRTAVINSSLTLAVALIMAADFLATGGDQLIGFGVPWLETGPVRMTCSFGVDGLSLWPMVVLALAGWTIVLAAESCCVNWTASAYAGLLLGQSLGLGIFAAQDFVLYFCCCAGWSWWSFAAVGRPGGCARRAAAQRYLLISSVGNGLVGIAATCLVVCQAGMARELYGKPGEISFEFSRMITGLSRSIHSHEIAWEFWSGYQPTVLLFCLGGLWLRWPMFPWHGWWPAVMSRARAPMAALFGAATALQAGYLLFRFIVPFCSDPGAEWPDWVCWVAAGTVFYAGVLACAQDQLRSLAGYLALSGLATALIAGVAGTA